MKEDLRVYRTKKLLRDSILELAIHQSKKLADITVQEICDQSTRTPHNILSLL